MKGPIARALDTDVNVFGRSGSGDFYRFFDCIGGCDRRHGI